MKFKDGHEREKKVKNFLQSSPKAGEPQPNLNDRLSIHKKKKELTGRRRLGTQNSTDPRMIF